MVILDATPLLKIIIKKLDKLEELIKNKSKTL